ncbi:acyl-CoA synthetase [Microbacterium sp. NPDC089320]|uniref:acyl-CoA synthetase n=1 Tax=Microbacterium sp. NPDC089320 TaxID=3155182 RepID=UPI0034281F99
MTYPGAHPAERTAILHADTGRTVTFGELDSRSDALARFFRDAGVARGDTVAFLADNVPEVFELYWAAHRSGLYVTGLNHHLTPAEIGAILVDSDAKALVVSPARGELAAAALRTAPAVGITLTTDDGAGGTGTYEQAIVAGAAAAPLTSQPLGATMLYSSGTTGRPKGIRPPLSGRQVDEPGDTVVAMASSLYGIDESTVYYSPAPVYHAAPLRWVPAVNALGGTVVLRDRFDAEQTLRDIEEYRITAGQFVPTMFVRLLKLPEEVRRSADVSSMRTAIHAAASCPVEVKQRMLDWWGDVVYEYYSSTELNGVSAIDPATWRAHPGSVGRAIVGTPHVCDETGAELPAGEAGLLYFERDAVAFEYHRDPEKTRAAQHPSHELWTTTGDVGYLDEDGFLYLTDRRAFTIISGGVNIYPQEIENALALHPAILDAAVIGLPDEEWGQSVTAVVQPAPTATPCPELAEEIVTFLGERIARFKVPRRVLFTDDLPRTPTGKLVKGALVERYSTAAP